jgi:hypothetical protein
MREETQSKMRWRAFVVGALVVCVFPSSASARSFRVGDIPNGSKYNCLSCHTDSSGSGFTNFGSNARSNLEDTSPLQSAHVDWPALCPLDSDGDGRSNGEELGDPNCVWSRGDTPSAGSSSNPGVANAGEAACNNGKLEKYEECDSPELMGLTRCLDADAGAGTLTCLEDCTFDYSDCSTPPDGWEQPGGVETEAPGCSVRAVTGDTSTWLVAGLVGLLVAGRRCRNTAPNPKET